MPKIVDHELYRKELLGKCFDLLSRKGYSNITIREIADETGVSTGSFYHYFPTKQSFLEEMFKHVSEENIKDAFSRVSPDMTLDEKINKISGFWKDSEKYYQNTLLLAIDFYRNHDSGISEKVFYDFAHYYTEAMVEIFEFPEQLARSIFIYFLGLILHSLFTPEKISYSDEINNLHDLLLLYQKNIAPGAAPK